MTGTSDALMAQARQYMPSLYLPSGDVSGRAVRYYRKLHKLNQAQLADLLGLSRRTLSSIENGGRCSRRSEEALYFFVMRTREVVEEHGVLPPDMRWDRLYAQESSEGVRKQYIKDFYIELDERVLDLKAKNRKLMAIIEEKDVHIRNLMKHRVRDITGIERQMEQQVEAMKAELNELREQIGSVA